MAVPTDRTLALDGIRGIAAVAVLLYHCGERMHAPWCVGHGALSVDVFFCMSGFVVERAYGDRLRAGWSAASFVRARLKRLYPLYAFGLALGTVAHLVVHVWKGIPVSVDVLGCGILLGALLIPSMAGGPGQIFPLNGPSWSLFVEAATNAGFAFVPKRVWTPAFVVAVTAAATVVMSAALMRLPLTYGGRSEFLWLNLARGTFGFGVGVLMSGLDRGQAFRAVPRLPTPMIFAALGALLLVPRGPLDVWFDPLAILLLCPAIVALAASSRPSPAVGRSSAWAGAVSYPLYIVQMPIVDVAAKLVPEGAASATSRSVALAVGAAAAVALAAAIARYGGSQRVKASSPSPDGATRVSTAVRALSGSSP